MSRQVSSGHSIVHALRPAACLRHLQATAPASTGSCACSCCLQCRMTDVGLAEQDLLKRHLPRSWAQAPAPAPSATQHCAPGGALHLRWPSRPPPLLHFLQTLMLVRAGPLPQPATKSVLGRYCHQQNSLSEVSSLPESANQRSSRASPPSFCSACAAQQTKQACVSQQN